MHTLIWSFCYACGEKKKSRAHTHKIDDGMNEEKTK